MEARQYKPTLPTSLPLSLTHSLSLSHMLSLSSSLVVLACLAPPPFSLCTVLEKLKEVPFKGERATLPTCISVNNCVGYNSPVEPGQLILSPGDLVKM